MKTLKKFFAVTLVSSMFLSVGSVSVLANTIENSQSKNISLEDVQKVFPEMKKVSTIPEGVEPFEIDSVEDLDELTEIVSQYGYNNEDISTYGFSSNYKSSGAYSIGTNEYESYLQYKINSIGTTAELSVQLQYYSSNPTKVKNTLARSFRLNGLTPCLGFTPEPVRVTTDGNGNPKITGSGQLKTYTLIESDLFELYTNSISMSYVVKDCLTVTNYNCIIR